MRRRHREIAPNVEVQIAMVSGPDRMSQMLASSLAFATSTGSPMSAGMHTSGTGRGFSGLDGHGVNRWAGDSGPLQQFAGAASPMSNPQSKRLGMGTGASGQPGLPGTGDTAGLGWLGYRPGGLTGIGG